MRYSFTSLLLLGALATTAPAQTSPELVVHEWGTFTTLTGSDGTKLSGLQFEEERLPAFVNSHSGFIPDPNQAKMMNPCEFVTTKMETPVLYFYSPVETKVEVRVDFPRGAITQWYPNRTDGEAAPANFLDSLHFDKDYNGWIKWSATILAPDSKAGYTAPVSQLTPTWTAPRETDANLVCIGPVGGQLSRVEKYLFYRGIGNVTLPLSLRFVEDELSVRNDGSLDIPYVLVYERTASGDVKFWGPVGSLGHDQEVLLSEPAIGADQPAYKANIDRFIDELVKAGLNLKEATAMIETWKHSYFDVPGLKVFWILPKQLTDKILPISITPTPTAIERVLVGRSEILKPSFEKQLKEDLKDPGTSGPWTSDRYYSAYKQRVDMMTTASVRPTAASGLLTLYPNPSRTSVTLKRSGPIARGEARIEIVDILGKIVARSEFKYEQLDVNLNELPIGQYLVKLLSPEGVETISFVKGR